MLRTVRLFLLLACCVALPTRAAHALDSHASVPTVHAAPSAALPAPAPSPAPLAPLSLLGFALAGATDPKKGRKLNLTRTYLFRGESYGPGRDIEVPEDFPEIDGETGDVIHPPGSAAARNAAASRRLNFASPPNTGGVNTGESGSPSTATGTGTGKTVSGKSQEDLEAMSKSDLADLATSNNITVDRLGDNGEPEDGEPLKRDYVRVLGATATA